MHCPSSHPVPLLACPSTSGRETYKVNQYGAISSVDLLQVVPRKALTLSLLQQSQVTQVPQLWPGGQFCSVHYSSKRVSWHFGLTYIKSWCLLGYVFSVRGPSTRVYHRGMLTLSATPASSQSSLLIFPLSSRFVILYLPQSFSLHPAPLTTNCESMYATVTNTAMMMRSPTFHFQRGHCRYLCHDFLSSRSLGN